MKKLFFLTSFIILISVSVKAQKQGNIWLFGEHSGLDFNSGTPVPIQGGQTCSDSGNIYSWTGNLEGCSSISDSSGHLLFYADGIEAWNRLNQVMPNGDSLMGGISSTNGAFIAPVPGSSNKFYLFTTDEFQDNLALGFRYSIVDMCLDNGLGDIVPGEKNILITDSVSERVAATFHADDTDVWIVVHKQFSNAFCSYLLTSKGLSAPVISNCGWGNPERGVANALGQMVISPDGRRLAFVVGNDDSNIAQLFDFDNATGIVSNCINLPMLAIDNVLYGLAFSPDNSKLYIRDDGYTSMVQFDLSAGGGNPDSVKNSYFSVVYPGLDSIGFYLNMALGLQLGPDGKIYAADFYLGVINNPNKRGDSCNFVYRQIPSYTSFSLPMFIGSYHYKNGIPSCVTYNEGINNVAQASLQLFPNPATDMLYISTNIQPATISITNLLGETFYGKQLNSPSEEISVTDFPPGIYLVHLKTQEGNEVKKWVKQ